MLVLLSKRKGQAAVTTKEVKYFFLSIGRLKQVESQKAILANCRRDSLSLFKMSHLPDRELRLMCD